MLLDFVDVIQRNRRYLYIAIFVLANVGLLSFCTQMLQAHRSDITTRIHNSQNAQALADTLGGTDVTVGVDHVANSVEIGMLRTVVSVTDGITKAQHALYTGSIVTLHAVSATTMATVRTAGRATIFVAKLAILPYATVGHGIGYAFGRTNSQLASVIQPKNDIAVPVITPEQAQQAQLIQNGTLAFEPLKQTGVGGACDAGAGNGGYPMDWCSAPIDTAQTVPYSADRINRECTSYAYWYFTTIEGHFNFHVTGNANRWAYTSNYPVHAAPAVGSIAVETAGSYGHVAIVHALPGQTYDGKTVPVGFVVVSEMNYDWYGHFRYSYSPVAKFAAYIY